MSKRMIASFVPNISRANCLANSSFLPTPVGPTKRKLPIGRLPSSKSCTVTTDGTCHCFNGFILTDNLSLANGGPYLSNVRYQSCSICDTGIPVIRSTDSATSLTVTVETFKVCCVVSNFFSSSF